VPEIPPQVQGNEEEYEQASQPEDRINRELKSKSIIANMRPQP